MVETILTVDQTDIALHKIDKPIPIDVSQNAPIIENIIVPPKNRDAPGNASSDNPTVVISYVEVTISMHSKIIGTK